MKNNILSHNSALLLGATLGLLCIAENANAASYTTVGAEYLETFNSGLPSSASTPAWVDNSIIDGWYAYQTGTSSAPSNYRITSTGSSSLADLYQFRPSASSTDGSLGTRPETATGNMMLGLLLTNDTGATLTEFILGYTGEQWYESSTVQNNQYVVSYQIGDIANLASGSWTDIDDLTFNTPHDGTGSSGQSLDGTLSANQEVLSPVTVTDIVWEDGDSLWIRWFDANSTGTDHGLAIDDVSFTAVPEPAAIGSLFGLGALVFAGSRRNYRSKSICS
ncbi:MAG: PEP-CTERM sorting domain-containing protein [Verrucomicrobiales bacterium]